MCEGIARAGNGICLMATDSESILGKTSKLVRASRTFILKNISIDWGLGEVPASAEDEPVVLQAPAPIEAIFPGIQFVVTALVKDKDFVIPQEVVLHGQRDGRGETFEVKIPVRQVELSSGDTRLPFISTIAARRLITQLENPRYEGNQSTEWKQATITRIGEEYQLASRYTSFIAVGDVDSAALQNDDDSEEGKYSGRPARFLDITADVDDEDEECLDYGESDYDMGFGLFDGDGPGYSSYSAPQASHSPVYTPTSPKYSPSSPSCCSSASPRYSPVSPSFSPTSPAFSPSSPTFSPSSPPYATAVPHMPSPGPSGGMAVSPFGISNTPPIHASAPTEVDLVRLQLFDGSFALTDEFKRILGEPACEEGRKWGVDDMIWTTILAIAYFQKHLAGERDLLEGLVEKAMDFVTSGLAETDFEAMLEVARDVVN